MSLPNALDGVIQPSPDTGWAVLLGLELIFSRIVVQSIVGGGGGGLQLT